MKKLLLLCLFLWTFADLRAQAVPDNRTPEKKEQDRKEMEAFKKTYPQYFQFNRVPLTLADSSILVQGYVSCIILTGNYVVDSIHSNFHADMPDTSTVTPLSTISVGGSRINVRFNQGNPFMSIWGPASITNVDPDNVKADSDYLPYNAHNKPFKSDVTTYARISLNGRLLDDWKPLDSFPNSLCKFYQRFDPKDLKKGATFNFSRVYQFYDIPLGINDKLLIEIKIKPKDWMIDRFLITRTPVSPTMKAGFSTQNATGSISQEETADLSPEKKTSFAPISNR